MECRLRPGGFTPYHCLSDGSGEPWPENGLPGFRLLLNDIRNSPESREMKCHAESRS